MAKTNQLQRKREEYQKLDKRDRRRYWTDGILNNALYILMFIFIVYTAIKNKNFLSAGSIANIISLVAASLPMALGIAGCIVLTGTDLSGGRVVPVAGYLRIDVQFERFARFVETLYGDETAQDTYLRCGDAYALVRGVTYGRQHAGDQPFELLRVQHSVVQRFRLGTQKEGVVAVVHGEQAHRAAVGSYQCPFFVREASVGCFRSACGECGAGQQQGGRSENGGWLVHGSFFVVVHCRLACRVPAGRLAPSTG